MRGRVELALAAVAGDRAVLPPHARRTQAACYARHILHADPQGRFTILALAWAPGQFSPVHGHHTWCGYVVLGGVLQETNYAYDHAAGVALPAIRETLCSGATRYAGAGLAAVHKLGNAGDNDAWSLHVYGVDSARIATHVNHVVPAAPAPSPQDCS
jgi:predicted metal-dependent enzyme (double-stranded beta helix superfamily)